MSAAAKRICVSSPVFLAALVVPSRAQTSLDEAYRFIASKTFVDLTHAFGPDTPVWSGFGQARMSPAIDPKTHKPYTIEKDGFRATYYEMAGQYSTHIDPPAHFANDGITMDKIPLAEMILPLVVFDATPYLAADPSHAFSLKDLDAWEAQNGRVPGGAFAALRTDMSKEFEKDPENFMRTPFPGWSLEAVKFLVEERPLSDRGHGQSRQGARQGRFDCGELAEGQGRSRFSRAGLCDSAVRLWENSIASSLFLVFI